jgi:hypothetical protein
VYPEGYRRSWADGRGKTPADQAGVDDVGFINALLEQSWSSNISSIGGASSQPAYRMELSSRSASAVSYQIG